ncbi:Hypp4966 [Branchiostoma lanceolatum]|uniref:Hypp4966 protein n=1 Tax=Branchiostoma lanceolatum TaxID=7740 RepID=A0A8K0ABF2_BRALA|nr:Hypp4966 [Branchiostoma lanceolatum]
MTDTTSGSPKETQAVAMATQPPVDKQLYPAVAMYGPCNVFDLQPGKVKFWCRCGLSKKQPWCDGSHKGTGITPLQWQVPPQAQRLYALCACKYSADPPFCEATHTNLPCQVLQRQGACLHKDKHDKSTKLCTGCGWVPDF